MSADEPGLSFGVAAAAYERGRPEWPAALLDALPLDADATVVDLAAGTGKLTRRLVRRYTRVFAVEPDPQMRALIDVAEPLAGTAESIPLGDASVDGAFVAEAFHWFDVAHAVREIARVLRPGGVLALLWNRFDPDDHVLPEGVMPESTSAKHRRFRAGEWRDAFRDMPFEPFRELSLEQRRRVGRAELLDYFGSISPVTALPPAERKAVLERVAAALDRPTYPRRWTACLYWTRRAA
ncbi:MAG: class I SAM-dependent methyltransferase [Actinomycetota bacterium]|nr:class I SAM-dependent methyltransferase [Actinomycetota bacterium]